MKKPESIKAEPVERKSKSPPPPSPERLGADGTAAGRAAGHPPATSGLKSKPQDSGSSDQIDIETAGSRRPGSVVAQAHRTHTTQASPDPLPPHEQAEVDRALAEVHEPLSGQEPDTAAGAEALSQALEDHPELSEEILAAAGPQLETLAGQLEGLEQGEASSVVTTLAEIASREGPQAAEQLAQALGRPELASHPGVVQGLASASLDDHTSLGNALAERFEDRDQTRLADQVRAATAVGAEVRALDELSGGGLEEAGQAGERLQDLAARTPGAALEVLLGASLENGSVGRLVDTLAGLEDISGGDDAAITATFRGLGAIVGASSDWELNDRVGSLLAEHISDTTGLSTEQPDALFRLGLQEAVASGHGSTLSVSVIQALHEQGQDNGAVGVLEGLNASLAERQSVLHDEVSDLGAAQSELNYFIGQFGPLMTPAELDAAVADYIEDHPGLNPSSAHVEEAFRDVAALDRLDEALGFSLDDARVAPITANLRDEAARIAVGYSGTAPGQEQLGQLLDQQRAGASTWLERVGELVPESHAERLQSQLASSTLRAGLSRVTEASAAGHPQAASRYLEGLEQTSSLFGLSEADFSPVTDSYQELVEATRTGSVDEVREQLGNLNNLLGGLDNSGIFAQAGLGNLLESGGRTVGVLGLVNSGVDFASEPGLASLQSLLFEGAQTAGHFSAELAPALEGFLTREGLDTLGRAAGWGSVALDAIGGVASLAQGDYAQGGFQLASATGSAALVAAAQGGALGLGAGLLTGVGAVVTVAAAVGQWQYNRVQASNRFENDTARDFVRHAFSGSDNPNIDGVVNHLVNADDNGRQVGILIRQAAERLNIAPEQFLDQLGQLDPDTVLDLVEAGHGVDPQSDNLTDLPQTSDNDVIAGPTDRPRSVQGWINYLVYLGVLEP